MTKRGRPTWWVLYAVLPLMAGLLVLEHRAAIPPVWHKFAQVGIVLCMHGLVWLWIKVNTIALLRAGLDKPVKTYVYEANPEALRSRRPPRAARPTYRGGVGAQPSPRYAERPHRMEIDRCSLN
jgi:hypothetical protein